jgi:DNA-binding phage protein
MKKSSNYYDLLRKELRDPEEASAYLNATLETGDVNDFLCALRNVVMARGNLSKISRRTKLNRANLYRVS